MYEYVHAQILLPLQKPSQWWEMKVSPLTPTVQSSCVHCGYADHLFFKRKIKGTLKNFWSKDYPKIAQRLSFKVLPTPSSLFLKEKHTCNFNLKYFSLNMYYQKIFRHIVNAGKSYPDSDKLLIDVKTICSSIQPLSSCSC